MMFTSWKFGPVDRKDASPAFVQYKYMMGDLVWLADQGREAARIYAADIFNWCSARRDYPYADHPQPAIPWPLHWCAAVEIKQNCEREFNRSNETRTV